MTRKEQAMEYFKSGYNCAQSLTLTFSDMTDMPADQIAKLASSFGGGMGRLREVCGAVTGMFIITGLVCGYSTPETGEVKAEHYAKIQELAARFNKIRESYLCRDLLGLVENQKDAPTPEARTEQYYKERPCCAIVGEAAEILEQFLKEQGKI